MSRKEFSYLLKKYNEGTCTEEEKAFVEHWYAVTQNEEREALAESDLDAMEPLMWQEIQNKIQAGKQHNELPLHPEKKLHTFKWLAVAASVIILIGVFLKLENNSISFNEYSFVSGNDFLEKANTTSRELAVKLPDGSEITLSPGASVKYRISSDQDKREVYLTGDAFFNVYKMPSKPFYVYTGNVVTKVLGTSFFVRAANTTHQVSVEVVTGRVAVYQKSEEKEDNGEVILMPNQKTTFKEDNKEFTTSLVDVPKLVAKKEDNQQPASFDFEEEPLARVVERLKSAYGIEIQLENEKLKDCPLTANLSEFTLYEQLDMICAATKSHYTLKGTAILIDGKGCANMQ
jgi:transmembrane sensor